MEYLLTLLIIGLLAGGIAFNVFTREGSDGLTDAQYREIRANMAQMARLTRR